MPPAFFACLRASSLHPFIPSSLRPFTPSFQLWMPPIWGSIFCMPGGLGVLLHSPAAFPPCRHYSDAVLVAVIALCTLENDVIHAGYLALALYFFRHRESLRSPALFRWLPLYNFGVMLVSLAYQAPLQRLWHGEPHRQVWASVRVWCNPRSATKYMPNLQL